jgi:hypothetical protein
MTAQRLSVQSDLTFDTVFHQDLARWNRQRLAVGAPDEAWRTRLADDHAMILAEGEFIEAFRAAVADRAAEAPADPDSFVAWFEDLRETGPGQNDPLFPWLAVRADLDDMRWFLAQEVAGEAGFDDLLCLTQVKFDGAARRELGANLWDELGQGKAEVMHGPMLGELARALDIAPRIETTLTPALALGNTMAALAANRRYAYQSIGALGVIELTAPWRAAHVDAGLKRLGVGRARRYFTVHATLDVRHSQSWNREVLRPLVAARPEAARWIAEGALMRLTCGARCFEVYRDRLWRLAHA